MPPVEGFQRGNVFIHEFRHFKCTDHILVAIEIDAGLAADAAVRLRKKCCRNLYIVDAAQVCGSGKTSDVADNASAECDQHRAAVEFLLDKVLID